MDPVEAWRQRRMAEGPNVTVIDLYEVVARSRGLSIDDLSAGERLQLARSVLPDVWPDHETTSDSERLGDVISVVDPDPTWGARYEEWELAIRAALGSVALRVEHVGSTSVRGLAAKPIVDIQVSVRDLEAEHRYVPELEEIGLQLRSRDSLHRYFRPFPGRPRDVHVHVCPLGSGWETDHLRFRDYLRTHPEARDEYAQAKRAAAATWADDGLAYTDAKTEVILAILERAGGSA